jgi:hypothetical protein
MELDLSDVEAEPMGLDVPLGLTLDAITSGHGMTELGASVISSTFFVCSCCCCC